MIISSTKKLESPIFVEKLLTKLQELRPNKIKRKWSDRRVLQNYSLTIDDLFEFSLSNDKMTDFDDKKITYFALKKWHKNEFRTLLEAKTRTHSHDPTEMDIEEFNNGRTYYSSHYERDIVECGKNRKIFYTRFGSFEFIEVFTGALGRSDLIIAQSSIIKVYLTFDKKHAYYHLPVSVNEEGKLSPKFMGLMSIMASMLAFGYWWFQSLPILLLIIGISFAVLSMSDAVNPQQKPIVRVIQIIVYAIVFVFLR